MIVNDIEITPETIVATRAHFVDIYKRCIAQAISGECRVNDLDKYIQSSERHIDELIKGNSDHTLTFVQRALWLQAGKMIAILS